MTNAGIAVGLSPSRICELFHRETGMTFHAFVECHRIERAKFLLRNKWNRIGSVASAVGYEDITTFARAFKRRVGTTPSQFRNSVDGEAVGSELLTSTERKSSHLD